MKFTDICLITKDVIELSRFYEKVFNAKAEGNDTHSFINVAGLGIAIYSQYAAEKDMGFDYTNSGTGLINIGFNVDDVDKEYIRISKMGLNNVTEPHLWPWGVSPFILKIPRAIKLYLEVGQSCKGMNKPSRKQTRLKDYNCSQAGYYFVTVCTHNMYQLFGEIIDGKIVLNNAGMLVDEILNHTPKEFSNIELNKYIIMPNHVHAIIIIKPQRKFVGANLVFARSNSSNDHTKAKTSFAPTMGNFVKSFKSKTMVEYIKGVKRGTFPPFQNAYGNEITMTT